jgi:transposase-like protein
VSTITHETIHQWSRKFGQRYANGLRRRRARPGDKWHRDEVFIKINGKAHYRWRAVDPHGNVLDILVTPRPDAKAATRFFRKLFKKLRYTPRALVTDKLRSYGVAHPRLMPSVEHRSSKYLAYYEPTFSTAPTGTVPAGDATPHSAKWPIPGPERPGLSKETSPTVSGRLTTRSC